MGENPELSASIPFAKQITDTSDIVSHTKMYWLIEPNVELTDPDVLNYRPADHDSKYEHIWKWNTNNYGGVRLLPRTGNTGIKEVNKIVCKKSFDILYTSTPNDYFNIHPYADYVWCVDPDYNLNTEINWAPDNFEPYYIHSFHLRGQLEHRYPESEGGIKLFPRDWKQADTKYHGFLDANIIYPILYVENPEDHAQRDIYTDDYVWLIDAEYQIEESTVDWIPNPFEENYIHVFKMPYQLQEKYPMAMGGIRLVPRQWRNLGIKIHDNCYIQDKKFDVFYTNKKFCSDTFDFYAKRSDTDWFWVVDRDFEFNGEFLFIPREHENDYIHVFKIPGFLEYRYLKSVTDLHDDRVAGVYLVNKNFDITKQKLRLLESPIKYDLFYTSDTSNYEIHARKSRTEMFWLVHDKNHTHEDITWLPQPEHHELINLFNCDIKLVPKDYLGADTKHHGDLRGFEVIEYQKFNSVDQGMSESKHPWFWVVDADVDISEDFKFDYIPDEWDTGKTHVWQLANPKTGLNYDYAGVRLCHVKPKGGRDKYVKKIASYQKEFQTVRLDASGNILEQLNNFESQTKMFWVIDPWVELHPEFDFGIYPTQWDQDCVHVFKDDKGAYRNVRLVPQGYEFKSLEQLADNSYPKLKEHNIIASVTPQWPVLTMNTPDKSILSNFAHSLDTPWFYTIDSDVDVLDEISGYEPSINDHGRVHTWQRINPHNKKIHSYGGVRLWPTHRVDEFTSDQIKLNKIPRLRYVKEPLSAYKPYPIVLLSYHEERAQTAFDALSQRSDNVLWVKDIKGIFEAHQEAAKLCQNSTMFWVVDADAELAEDFDFSYIPDVYDQETVHVWASLNPVTGSKYGYGGVKLFNTQQVSEATSWGLDFTTGLSKRFKFMTEVSCTTRFNTTAYDTWRSAFREVVKLTISTDPDAKYRIEEWLHPISDSDYSHDAKRGAQEAVAFAKQNNNNQTELDRINDYDWLKKKFQEQK